MFNTALVTGASGFIGENLVRHLYEKGLKVTCIVRSSTDKVGLESISNNIRFIEYSGTYESMKRAFESEPIEQVFHLATNAKYEHSESDLDEIINANITLGAHLAEAMKNHDSKILVNTSSHWQYYESKSYRPLNLYAATKQAFVDILKFYSEHHGLKVANVILFDTYGIPDKRNKLASEVIKNRIHGRAIDASPGEQVIDLSEVSDIVKGLWAAACKIAAAENKFETYIAGAGQAKSLKDAIATLAKKYGSAVTVNWGAKPYRKNEVFKIEIYDCFENLIPISNA